MNDLSLQHHYAIRMLGESFADAANQRDFERFAQLWTENGVWAIGAPINVKFTGQPAIRQAVEQLLNRWDFFVQMPHAPVIKIDGQTATACWTVQEIARTKDLSQGNSNLSFYHDVLVNTPMGWRFLSRRYQTIYSDPSPLVGQSSW
jgi:ketosteroid isomerase-like protein